MSRRTAAWLAWTVWALSLPLVALAGVLRFLRASVGNELDAAMPVFLLLLVLTFPTVGALIASRRPENPIGWIFCAVGLVFGVGAFAESYVSYSLYASSDLLPGVQYAAWFSSWASFPVWLLGATMLYLLFPDGKLPYPRVLWRPLAWTAVVAGAMSAVGGSLSGGTDYPSIANPTAVGGAVGDLLKIAGGFGSMLLAFCGVVSIAAPFLRLRRTRGQERQQLKWFVYATIITGVCFISIAVSNTVWPASPPDGSLASTLGGIAWNLMIVSFLFLPVATAVAILRYRLYDIDRIINRTLVYGALTAMLVAIYFGSIVVLQRVFVVLTGQESTLAVVVSTLAIAALFNPLRRRLQAFVDRRFYRRKYDARKTLEAFSSRLRDETNLQALSDDLAGVVRGTMRPAHVSVWLHPIVGKKGGRAEEP